MEAGIEENGISSFSLSNGLEENYPKSSEIIRITFPSENEDEKKEAKEEFFDVNKEVIMTTLKTISNMINDDILMETEEDSSSNQKIFYLHLPFLVKNKKDGNEDSHLTKRAFQEIIKWCNHYYYYLMSSETDSSSVTNDLSRMKSTMLSEVIRDDDKSLAENTNLPPIDKWTEKFCEKLQTDDCLLVAMLQLINYLDSDLLLTLLCKTAGEIINGRSIDGICEFFNIKREDIPELNITESEEEEEESEDRDPDEDED